MYFPDLRCYFSTRFNYSPNCKLRVLSGVNLLHSGIGQNG